MKRVILDTNFLLIPSQFNIDIFTQIEELMKEPFELCTIDSAMEELKKLAEGNSKDAMAAKLGFVLAQQKGLKTLTGFGSYVDDALLETVEGNTIVATLDKDLKKKLQSKGCKVITMRQKKFLVLEG